MIFVDSSVWIDYFCGTDSPQTQKLNQLFGTGRIVVGDLILTEVLQGFGVKREFDEALDLFGTLHIVRLGGYRLAVKAAQNFRLIRSKGFAIRTIDSLIATTCTAYNFELLHVRDFVPFEKHLGLKCVSDDNRPTNYASTKH